MSLFNVDYQKFVRNRLPAFLRNAPRLQYIYSMINELKQVNGRFVTFSDDVQFRVKFDSRVIYLEEYLNLTYDATLKRIFISDGNLNDRNYIFNYLEGRDSGITMRNQGESMTDISHLRNRVESFTEYDYIINIPTAITFVENEVRARVNKYNAAGMRYNIVTV